MRNIHHINSVNSINPINKPNKVCIQERKHIFIESVPRAGQGEVGFLQERNYQDIRLQTHLLKFYFLFF